jgi:Dinucleotide-utilizing enzymes involved in molybdopterin and thiamine biosynthesis family 2
VPGLFRSAEVVECHMILPSLSNEEIRRYSRHLILPEFGMEGQRKLKQGSVLLIGTGGLGSPLALYLAAAGVGHIGLVDFDIVDESNLQRQIIHGTSTLGIRKTESAKMRLRDLNPHIDIATYDVQITSENAFDLIRPYDVIVDGTDNFPTRYLTNDACVMLGKPNVYGSIFRFEGQATVFSPKHGGPCYRCLYPEPPPPGLVPSCAEGGVLGVLPGVVGTIQATEAIKLLTGIGEPLIGRLLLYDALAMRFRELKLRRNPDCPVCGDHPTVTELIDYQQFCGISPEEAHRDATIEITPAEVADWLHSDNPPFLLDVREPNEWEICHIPGAVRISVNELAERMNELDSAVEMVVYCRSGVRSARAVELLRQAGFRKVKNMAGGILRWSDEVDPSVPKY